MYSTTLTYSVYNGSEEILETVDRKAAIQTAKRKADELQAPIAVIQNDESNGEQHIIMTVHPAPPNLAITIQRVERVVITGESDQIDTHTFTNWDSAFQYLEAQGWPLTDEHKEDIQAHPYTETNTKMEMVNRGDCAYSAPVYYVIETKGGQNE